MKDALSRAELEAKRVRKEHQDELKRNAAEVERMIKSHNSDIDRKDTEIKRLLSEADNERNRRDEELGKVKATHVEEMKQFRNQEAQNDSEHRKTIDQMNEDHAA